MCIQDHKSSPTMKVKIPHELVLKFVSLDVNTLTSEYKMTDYQQYIFNRFKVVESKKTTVMKTTVMLDLSHNPICFNACKEWFEIIQKYYKTSQKSFRLDIGPFKGICPVSLDCNGMVEFIFDDYDDSNRNWKEWFMKEGIEYAPK